MHYSLDRFEGDYALLEQPDGTILSVKRQILPAQARAGDVLQCEKGIWQVDAEETACRRARIREKLSRLWED